MEKNNCRQTQRPHSNYNYNTYSVGIVQLYILYTRSCLTRTHTHTHSLTDTHTSHTSSLKAIRPKLKLLSRKLEVLRGLNYILSINKRLTSTQNLRIPHALTHRHTQHLRNTHTHTHKMHLKCKCCDLNAPPQSMHQKNKNKRKTKKFKTNIFRQLYFCTIFKIARTKT